MKGILSFLVVYAYYVFVYYQKPFGANFLNSVDLLSAVVCALSLIIGVLLYQTLAINMLVLSAIGFVLIILCNLVFFLVVIFYLFQGYLAKFAFQLDAIRDKILEKKPELRNTWIGPFLVN